MNNKKHKFALRKATLCITLAFGGVFGIGTYLPAAADGSVLPATQQMEFAVVLPLQNTAELDQLLAQQRDPQSPNYHRWLTPQDFKTRFGANPDSLARVIQHLQSNGLTVVSEHAQGIRVRGDAAAIQTALGLSAQPQTSRGMKRMLSARNQSLRAELRNEGAIVAAFAPIPNRRVHSVITGPVPANRYGTDGAYWFTDIKQAYDFPAYPSVTGAGATVAILMASDVLDSDTAAVFNHEKWTENTGLPVPSLVRVPVLGGAAFDPQSGASMEASLDVQQVMGMAPGATTMLYNVPDLSNNSLLTAYQQIVTDNKADIVSSSFGGPEDLYTAAYNQGTDYTSILQAYEQIFKQGNAQGITFVASSGDSGGLSVPEVGYFYGATSAKYVAGVEHPASSPSVTSVGGTNLQTVTGQGLNSSYVSENAYGDPLVPSDPYGTGINVTGGYWGSGGGVSKVFAQPAYQKLVNTGSTSMRTVPDVSLMEGGCPGTAVQPCGANRSAVVISFNGTLQGAIGTSVSAPQFAGALALAVQNFGGRLGNINTMLYQKALVQSHHIGAPVFHTGVQGFNGYEYTAPVYNQVIGLGSPYVRQLIGAPKAGPAGNPKTKTNP